MTEKTQTQDRTFAVRGRVLTARVVSAKMRRTAVCEIEHTHEIKKYQRQEKRISRIKVHNPDTIAAKEGDIVRIGETRPISKTKTFVILEKVN